MHSPLARLLNSYTDGSSYPAASIVCGLDANLARASTVVQQILLQLLHPTVSSLAICTAFLPMDSTHPGSLCAGDGVRFVRLRRVVGTASPLTISYV